MDDGVGINNAGLWLDQAESALFTVFLGAVRAGDSASAYQWLDMLERLSIV